MRVIAACVAFLAGAAALAGPGDGRELNRYRGLLSEIRLRCPPGTRLNVQGAGDGFEETCVTGTGVRHGYYLRWFEDAQTWAELGRYEQGRPVGRWLRFGPDGRPL